MTKSFKELKFLPQLSGIYAFKLYDFKNKYFYIGYAHNLKKTITNQLIGNNKKIIKKLDDIFVISQKISFCNWWIHKDLNNNISLEAAYIIAIQKFNPTLHFFDLHNSKSINLSKDKKFIKIINELFSYTPSGYIKF